MMELVMKRIEVVGMLGGKRGQAAMEYLMTYGWALLVIVIVIAILLMINPFSAPQGCRFDSLGFVCGNPVIQADGTLYLSITNGNNNNVNICGVVCTSDKSPTPPTAPTCSNILLPRQAIATLNGVQCKKDNVDLTLSSGAEFSGKLWLFYRNEEDGSGYPIRTASASVTTKAVAGGGTGTGTITINAGSGTPPAGNPGTGTQGEENGACRTDPANLCNSGLSCVGSVCRMDGTVEGAACKNGACDSPLACDAGTNKCKTAAGATCNPPCTGAASYCCPPGSSYVGQCKQSAAGCGPAV